MLQLPADAAPPSLCLQSTSCCFVHFGSDDCDLVLCRLSLSTAQLGVLCGPLVTVPRTEAAKLTSFTESPEIAVRILIVETLRQNKVLPHRFVLCEEHNAMKMCIRVIGKWTAAKEVSFEMPSSPPGLTIESVRGLFVCPGVQITSRELALRVSCVRHGAGLGGLAEVTSATKLRFSSTPPLLRDKEDFNLVQQSQEEISLEMFLLFGSPSSSLLIEGPRSAGKRRLLERCCRQLTKIKFVFHFWTTDSSSRIFSESDKESTLICILDPAEKYFPANAKTDAKLIFRGLLNVLRTLHFKRFLLVGITDLPSPHGFPAKSFFDRQLTISSPTRSVRLEILKPHFPTEEALKLTDCLDGLTTDEVLQFIQTKQLPTKPTPFKEFHVVGYADIRRRLHGLLLAPSVYPEQYNRFNVRPPRGILLSGPPGCGKTTLVKELCSSCNFFFQYLDSASILSAYVGEAEERLRAVFQEARLKAPSLIFFDEVEALASRRAEGNRSGREAMNRLLATLLTEMDGFSSELMGRVCFVGATNLPGALDPAVLRPGRFDVHIEMSFPDESDRRELIETLLQSTTTAEHILEMVQHTKGMSMAQIAGRCRDALLNTLQSH